MCENELERSEKIEESDFLLFSLLLLSLFEPGLERDSLSLCSGGSTSGETLMV
jgi:hypothetical protein